MEFFLTSGGNVEWPENSLISEEEMKLLMTGFFKQRAITDGTISEEEAMKIIRWAERARLDSFLLDLVLERQLNLDIKDGEIVFTKTDEIDETEIEEG